MTALHRRDCKYWLAPVVLIVWGFCYWYWVLGLRKRESLNYVQIVCDKLANSVLICNTLIAGVMCFTHGQGCDFGHFLDACTFVLFFLLHVVQFYYCTLSCDFSMTLKGTAHPKRTFLWSFIHPLIFLESTKGDILWLCPGCSFQYNASEWGLSKPLVNL